jgi:hypothetical protein
VLLSKLDRLRILIVLHGLYRTSELCSRDQGVGLSAHSAFCHLSFSVDDEAFGYLTFCTGLEHPSIICDAGFDPAKICVYSTPHQQHPHGGISTFLKPAT